MIKINRRGLANNEPLQRITHYTFTLYTYFINIHLASTCKIHFRSFRFVVVVDVAAIYAATCFLFFFLLLLFVLLCVLYGASTKSDSVRFVLVAAVSHSTLPYKATMVEVVVVVVVYGPINITQNVVHIIIGTRRIFLFLLCNTRISVHLHNGFICICLCHCHAKYEFTMKLKYEQWKREWLQLVSVHRLPLFKSWLVSRCFSVFTSTVAAFCIFTGYLFCFWLFRC